MKKIVVIAIMAILLVSAVSAKNIVKRTYKMSTEGASQVRVEEHIREQQPECHGSSVHQSEVNQFNSNSYFQEALEQFDDGYHVIELTKSPYLGYDFYTVYKDNNKVRNIRQGFCAEDDYHAYEINIDIEQTMADLEAKEQAGTLKPITEGLHIIRSIKGLSIYQQSKLIGVGTRYFTESLGWQNEVDDNG